MNRQTMLGKVKKYAALILLVFMGLSTAFAAGDLNRLLQWVRAGKLTEAGAVFSHMEKSRDFTESRMLGLCDSLEAMGHIPLAVDFLKTWRTDHPFSRKIDERLADYALQINQLNLAIDVYTQLAETYPKNRDYWLALGKLYTWAEKQKQAIHAYKKALALNPKDVKTLRKLAQLYSWTNQDKKAYAVQTEILKLDPQDVALWKKHGIQARWLNKNAEAIVAFKNVLLRDPKDAEAFFLLGQTYLWTNQTDKARLCFKETLRLDPNNFKARLYWAQIRQWEPFGWWEAKQDYKKVLQRHPGDKESLKGLAWIRKNYGPLIESSAQYIHDSNDLNRTDGLAYVESYVSARIQLRANGVFNQLEENKPTGHFLVSGQGLKLGSLWHVSTGTRLVGLGGFIRYNTAKVFGLAELQWQQRVFDRPNWPGQFYSSLSFIHDQVLDGVLAVKNGYMANRGKWSLYWQPDSAFHAGSDFQHSWYSDKNEKTQLYVTAEYRPYSRNAWQFFVTGLLAYENMKYFYLNAMPYWTPKDFWTHSAGIAAKWQPTLSVSLRTDVALTRQTGDTWALNYKMRMDWLPGETTRAYVLFQSYGSKYYAYTVFRAGFSYRW